MNRILVLYDSASSNTAKMAKLVAEFYGLGPGVDSLLKNAQNAA